MDMPHFEEMIDAALMKDSKPPLKYIRWYKRLRREFHCSFQNRYISPNHRGKYYECNCEYWVSPDAIIYRFFLCPAVRSKKELPWTVLFNER
jgi:hypothetical protein